MDLYVKNIISPIINRLCVHSRYRSIYDKMKMVTRGQHMVRDDETPGGNIDPLKNIIQLAT